MDLTFQDPMKYFSVQHQILLSPQDTSTTELHFHFGTALSFFLEILVIALCSPPVAYWTPSNLRGSSSSVIYFVPFHTVHGALAARMLEWFAIPSSSDHVLSELCTMTCPSWVALHGLAHCFTELDKAVVHVIKWFSFL